MVQSYIFYLLIFFYGNTFAENISIGKFILLIFCWFLLLKILVHTLIKRWAPFIWLAPNEKYYPSNVEDFLINVKAVEDENYINSVTEINSSLPVGSGSGSYYLVPKNGLGKFLLTH